MATNSSKENTPHLPKWAQRLLYVFSALIVLWLILYIAFRTPAVQSYLTGLAEDKVSDMLNTKVTIGGIDIDFLDQIVLEEVYIEDQQGDTLLYSGKLDVAFDAWAAVSKTISIDHVIIADTYINLYQLEGKDTLNFEFIPEAFASDTTTQVEEDTTSSSWDIQVSEVLLSNIRFDYDADSTVMQMGLKKLNLLFDDIELEEQRISASELDIDGLAFRMQLPATPDTTAADTAQQEEADTTDSNVINPSGYTFEFGEISIANSEIGYQVGQVQNDSTTQQMNFENLALADIRMEVEDVRVGAKDVALDMPLMAFTEANSGFRLEEFDAQVRMDMPSISLTLNELRTGHSELNGNVDFGMVLSESTAELMNSISLKTNLNGTLIGLQDAAYFSDALSSYPALSEMEAQLDWQVNMENGEGVMDRMELTLADQVRLLAEASFRDLGTLDSAVSGSPYFNFNLNEFSTNYAFLSSLLDDSTAQYLETLGQKNLSLTAQAEGTLDDIQGNASLRTGIGRLLANGSYQNLGRNANIRANLQTRQLDLRTVMLALGNPDSVAREYGKLSMTADMDAVQSFGQDTSFSTVNANVVIHNLGYKGYQYEGLELEAQKNNDDIEARIDYADSLLQLHANAQAVLKGEESQYQMEMNLENANLFRLNLVQDSIIINNTRMQAEAQGNTVDNIVGTFKVTESSIIRGENEYELDSLLLIAENSEEGRSINFYSDHIDAGVSGAFSFTDLPLAIEEFTQYYMSAYEEPLANEDVSHTDTNQELFITLNVKETPLLARAFMPSLNIAQPISANAYFNSDRKKLTFRLYAPDVAYQDYKIDSLLFTAQTSEKAIRFNTRTNFIQAGGLTIPEVVLQGNLSGVMEDSLNENREPLSATEVDLNLRVGAEDAPYRLDLNTVISSSRDTITVNLDPSELVVEEKAWNFSPEARILYATDFLEIDSFYLQQDEQLIQINTNNQQEETNLRILIDQLAIGPLLASLDLDDYMVDGNLNIEASLQNLFQTGDLESELTIDDLVVRDMPVGRLELRANGNNLATPEGNDPLQLEMALNGSNNELALEGSYGLDTGYFDIDIDINRFQLDPWQAFAEEYVEDLAGILKADLRVQGTASEPSISGNFTFADEVRIIPSITGAPYYINDQTLEFNGEELVFNQFTIEDSARTEARIDGNINFANMSNPSFNLAFDTDNFLLLSSESFQNESFYGRAFATAFLEIEGELSDIRVTGDVSINEGTNMTIAMVDEAGEAAQAEYIQFVDATGGNAFLKSDTVSAAGDSTAVSNADSVANETLEISGFSLSTDIHISPEAQFTIIIDPVNGDQITASGEADLQVAMSPNGEMNMQGTYILEDGAYVLTFAQFVKKEFQIREGSTLTWSGDPANAQFDITAVYTAETTVEGLLSSDYRKEIVQSGGGSYITTEQPVNVLMNISGELTEPELSFDIEIPELEAAGMSAQVIQNLVEQMQQDETQLYKQVFALIVLNRFLPIEGGFGSGGGGSPLTNVNQRIDQSLSRMLSSTLTNLGEDYLGGVQIDLNLQSDELQAQNTALADRDLNVQVSKQFFSDRLTVSAGGMTSLNTNSSAGTGAGGASDNQFYGEFEVLYRLDNRGNLNIRIFQKSERDIFTNDVDIRQGFSLRHQKTFDQFFEDDDQVLRSRPRREEEDQEEEQSSSKEDTALDNAQRRKRNK